MAGRTKQRALPQGLGGHVFSQNPLILGHEASLADDIIARQSCLSDPRPATKYRHFEYANLAVVSKEWLASFLSSSLVCRKRGGISVSAYAANSHSANDQTCSTTIDSEVLANSLPNGGGCPMTLNADLTDAASTLWRQSRHRRTRENRRKVNEVSRRQAVSLVIILIIATASLAGCRRASQPAATPAQPKAPQEQQHKAENNAAPVEPKASESSTAAPKAEPVVTETGTQLYARHCSACHGERGDGKGVAAVFLFPKPRDFRAGKFRLVSTSNNVPTREDLQAVLLRGMPGSSMPAWAHLSQPERDRLVDEVMRLRVDGVRETVVGRLKEEEGMTDQEIADSTDAQKMIEDEIKSATTPGEGRAVPTIGQPTEASIARGKENYAKFVCISCHGASGRGDGVQEMFDDEKLPARPRDFTLGIFKGNTDPSSIYRRIAFGMPGTPMPASSTMTSEQMVDLVHYILSLSTEKQRQAVVPKREKLVVNRVTEIPSSSADNEWAKISPIHLQLTPLWWRTDTDPNFQVQAAHDGKTLAIRMTWLDSTPNLDSLHSASFKDAIALELYRGSAEPFLGMGSPESVVDVWFWDADRQNKLASVDQANPNAIVDYFPFNEASVSSAELSRPTGLMAGQPAISLPARSVGNQIVPPANDSGGSSLQAAGPRTLTFRMPANQIVKAHGEWADGRWTVVMKRPLAAASPDDGISLEPGASSSIAFAAWDGSHQDRNGQKFVTFWQDLEIEK